MNYKLIYNSLIERAKNRNLEEYTEKHHIIPKCMGGSNKSENLVRLTPEEHFIAHALLVKMHPNFPKLAVALNNMTAPVEGRKKRKLYGWMKRRFSEAMKELQKGKLNSNFGKQWITNGNENKLIVKSDFIPDGWYLGRSMPMLKKYSKCVDCGKQTSNRKKLRCEEHFKENQSARGRNNVRHLAKIYDGKMFITDGIKDKLHDITKEIPEGYRKGRVTGRRYKK